MSKKTDTHFYDTKLKDVWNNYINNNPDCPISFKTSIKETIKASIDLPKVEKKEIDTVLKLLSDQLKDNYDKKNQIKVSDLYPRVWIKVREFDPDGKKIFYEQLRDILKGKCAQGRTTRLIQFL